MPPKASSSKTSDATLSVPDFLKHLTGTYSLSMSHAIALAGPLLKAGHSTPTKVKALTPGKCKEAGIKDEELVKTFMDAIKGKGRGKKKNIEPAASDSSSSAFANSPVTYKRKRDSDLDAPLPSMPSSLSQRRAAASSSIEDAPTGDLDFHEILDDDSLMTKSITINRAPIMQAWACVVAERLGFKRQEALSLAAAYTSLNATARGVATGVIPASSLASSKTAAGSSQPHVELMGRSIPVLPLTTGEWRAVAGGQVSDPEESWGYIKRSMRQQMGATVGAMRRLAESYPPGELNLKGYSLYCDFRPNGGEWGQRSNVRLETILSLRPTATQTTLDSAISVSSSADDKRDFRPVIKSENGRPIKAEDVGLVLDAESEGGVRPTRDAIESATDDSVAKNEDSGVKIEDEGREAKRLKKDEEDEFGDIFDDEGVDWDAMESRALKGEAAREESSRGTSETGEVQQKSIGLVEDEGQLKLGGVKEEEIHYGAQQASPT